MPPHSDDTVVSPELALVDGDLAARARAAYAHPFTAARVPPRPKPALAVVAAPRRRRRLATPVLMLAATAASSLIVTAMTGPDRADGVSQTTERTPAMPSVLPAEEPAKVNPNADAKARTNGVEASPETDPAAAVESRTTDATSTPPKPKTTGRTRQGTTLVWRSSVEAASYELELRRGEAIIFAARSDSPRIVVPRRWEREGVRYTIRPEDQAYVWRLLDGRRRPVPVVDGVLAMELTLVGSFLESGGSRTRP